VLQQHIKNARLREDVVQVNYEEGRSLYRKGRIEEIEGNVSQAQDLYRRAIAKMQEGRKLTKCDSRVKQFDKAIGQINSHQTQKATPKIGNCDIPKDFAAQKRALHARIKKGNAFREDGGGQWNPTFVMRAGYSVGSEQLKATALALNAMSDLVGGYEQCYAKFWSFMEGELVQLTKARDAAYKKSWAEGQRLNGILGKRKAEAASALNTCIIDSDNTFKAAMKKAQELCK
jgi:tetratricopeptide (TPR) repeat protein